MTNTTLTNAKVIRKFGKWTVESYKHHNGGKSIAVSDGWFVDYPIFYQHKKAVGYDYPEKIPTAIKNYLFRNYKKFVGITK